MGLVGAVGEINMNAPSDPKLMAGELATGITLSLLQVIPALLGLSLSYWSLKKSDTSPKLFVIIFKFYSYLWLLFIPIGTFLGYKQLKLLGNA